MRNITFHGPPMGLFCRDTYLTPWGLFHNLGESSMDVRYIHIHIAGRRFGIMWQVRHEE
jgi:hypothetical protein